LAHRWLIMAKNLYFSEQNSSLMKHTLLFLIVIALAGCSKYPDGPGVSVLSRKSRMVNHWELETATANGESWTPYFPLKEMELRDDFSQTTTFRTLNVPTILDGKWEFEQKKEHLKLTFDNGAIYTYRINKLKKDELRLVAFSHDTTYTLNYITYR